MALTANDVLNLSRAGYNSAQIAELAKAVELENVAVPAEQEQEKPEMQEKPAKPAKAAAAKGSDPGDGAAENASILAKLDALTSAVQMSNMRRDMQPEKETPESILANIIRPARTDTEKKGE